MALNIKPIKFNKPNINMTSIRNSKIFRVMKYGSLLLIFLLLIAVGFAIGVYFKLVNVDQLIHKYKLADVPIIGQYVPKPVVNFETVEPASENQPQVSSDTPATDPNISVQPQPLIPPAAQQAGLPQQGLLTQQPSGQPSIPDVLTPINLEQQKKEEAKRISKLARIYAAMKPEEAAGIIAQLDDETVIAVLNRMEEEQAAKIFALIDSARAARLSRGMIKR